jgi:O-antigen/teichoic acid export membrane protein
MKTAKNNNWLLAGIFNGLQKLSIPIFGLVSTMILAKGALTVEEMGVWSLFLVVTSFVELIRQALVKTSMIKYVNHAGPEDQKYILSSSLFLNIIVTISLIIVLLFTAVPIANIQASPDLDSMLYIFLGGMLLLIPFSHFEWIMYSKSEFKGLFWTYFFRQGISLLLMILFLIFNGKITLNQLVIFYCIGIAVGIGVSYIYVANHLEKVFSLSGEWTKKLWHFGKFVFGSGLSTLVFANAAQMMMAPMLGTTIFNALQGVSARVVNLADMPSQVLSDLLFPKSAKKENAENKELIKYYYEKTVGATLCFTIPMILFILLFPKFIILFISGPEYLDAIPFLQLLSVTGIFLAFLKQYGVIIDSTGRPAVNFTTITIIAMVYVVFTYFGIKQYGFMGAAYALIAAHVVGFIMTQIILYRYFGINFLNCFKQAFLFYPELTKMILDKAQWKTN